MKSALIDFGQEEIRSPRDLLKATSMENSSFWSALILVHCLIHLAHLCHTCWILLLNLDRRSYILPPALEAFPLLSLWAAAERSMCWLTMWSVLTGCKHASFMLGMDAATPPLCPILTPAHGWLPICFGTQEGVTASTASSVKAWGLDGFIFLEWYAVFLFT